MIEGQWEGAWRPTDGDGDGAFVRKQSVFRSNAPIDPLAEPGRYHLFVAWTCPWAHRTLLARSLKGLSDAIPVHHFNTLSDHSWVTDEDDPEVFGATALSEMYLRADPRYTGRVTVPVLWDTVEQTIVNNESSEILALFDAAGDRGPTLRPPELVDEIEQVSAGMYNTLNNGVYRAGFATSQEAYDGAVADVFEQLATLEARLEGRDWLVGDQLTEADLRLFVTTFRFDGAYYSLFRCNVRKLADHPNLLAHLQRVYAVPGVAETCNLEAMRRGYASVRQVNPSGIVPAGPKTLLVPEG